MKRKSGWFFESRRHSLASKGVKSAQKIPSNMQFKRLRTIKNEGLPDKLEYQGFKWELNEFYRYIPQAEQEAKNLRFSGEVMGKLKGKKLDAIVVDGGEGLDIVDGDIGKRYGVYVRVVK